MAERVDVCIVGSGLRRLDLRLPARRALPGRGPDARASWCSSAAAATSTPTSGSRCDIDHLSTIYGLIQGQGAQIVVGDGVGGGSNLYLAASLRSPQRDLRAPRPPPRRRARPAHVAEPDQPRDAQPLLRAGRGGAARAAPDLEPGVEVGRPVGGDARRRRATPATACRSRSTSTAASRRSGATPAASSARRTPSSRTTSRRPSALGVQVRPELAGRVDPPQLRDGRTATW